MKYCVILLKKDLDMINHLKECYLINYRLPIIASLSWFRNMQPPRNRKTTEKLKRIILLDRYET